MKKTFLATMVAVAAIGCYAGFNSQSNAAEKSILSIANIEALTSTEASAGGVYDKNCIHEDGALCCPDSGPVVRDSRPE